MVADRGKEDQRVVGIFFFLFRRRKAARWPTERSDPRALYSSPKTFSKADNQTKWNWVSELEYISGQKNRRERGSRGAPCDDLMFLYYYFLVPFSAEHISSLVLIKIAYHHKKKFCKTTNWGSCEVTIPREKNYRWLQNRKKSRLLGNNFWFCFVLYILCQQRHQPKKKDKKKKKLRASRNRKIVLEIPQ